MSQIKTFARVKPSRELFDDVDIVDGDLLLRIPDAVHYYTSPAKAPTKLTHQFHFDQVFQPETSQEQVFVTVAVDIIDAFLAGYNGTIFAYGQTGTGKTYTVEGGVRRYRDRGLAARALSRIYSGLAGREDEEIAVHVSFLEIYQEVGYDLLNPAAQGQSLVTPFPRVTVMEGPGGSCVIRDLTCHLAASEEVAQNLLLQGQLNRKVAETPVNQRSSRSHAVLTITLSAKKTDSDVIVKSKLHLVDLAGSERVAKTGVDGQQLNEAKSINLSLHHLESVIIALQSQAAAAEGRRKGSSELTLKELTSDPGCAGRHIPYRNSLLTMLLRDSLGGNCLTAMVATISLEWENLGETISTCRFAQRVACIANSVRRNEEIDDRSLVRILRKKIAELETEITFLKLAQGCEDGTDGGTNSGTNNGTNKLTDEDKLRCGQVIRDYILGHIRDPISAGITDPFKFRECMRILKTMVKQQANKGFQESGGQAARDEPASRASYTPHSRPSTASSHSANHRQAATTSSTEAHNRLKTRSKSMSNLFPDGERRPTSATGLVRTNSEDMCCVDNVERTGSASRAMSSPLQPRPRSAQQVLSKSPYAARQRNHRPVSRASSPQHHNTALSPESLSKLQLLTKTFKDLERKRDQCEAQLRDQRAYISHLQATDIEGAVLDQECRLEGSLCKTQMSIRNKLERVYQRMVRLCVRGEGGSEGEGDRTRDTRRWEDRYGQFRKSDGSLNTKQVLEAISHPNNKMGHASPGDGFAGENLFEKENATRQKLLHFKKLLQENKMLVNPDPADDSDVFVPPTKLSHPGSNSTPKPVRVVAWEMDRSRTNTNKPKRTTETSPTVNEFSDDFGRIYGESMRGSHNTHHSYTDALESPNCINNNVSTPSRSAKVDDKHLFSPSEYVNRIGSQEVFDAHQMGLYSKSFEAALTSMLERDNAKLFSHDHYNRYARGSSPEKRSSKLRKAGQLPNSSMANFVQNHFETYQEPTVFRGYSHTFNSEAEPVRQSPVSSHPEEESVTVQATPDTEREQSFMSKAREQRSRIEKIRRAQSAASLIQRTWRRYRGGRLQTT